MLSQGKDDNEAGWEKDKQETVKLDARAVGFLPGQHAQYSVFTLRPMIYLRYSKQCDRLYVCRMLDSLYRCRHSISFVAAHSYQYGAMSPIKQFANS